MLCLQILVSVQCAGKTPGRSGLQTPELRRVISSKAASVKQFIELIF
jgi:hypothetical protein